MLTLLGLNHRSAPLDLREAACFPEDEIPSALLRLRESAGAEEALILATCNRVELVTRVAAGGSTAGSLREFLARERRIDPAALDRHAYVHDGLAAARHLFGVACGLDSMILGEPQILGQVKRAYETARAHGATGPVLDHLFQQVLAAAKRVRTSTGISRHAVSVGYAAATLARNLFDDLHGRPALIVGAGKMTDLAARHLAGQGVTSFTVANRTYARAAALAAELNGNAVPWDAFPAELERVDVVLTGTAATEPILTRDAVRRALPARRGRPLLIVDIAVPRDVEPATNDLPGVYLYDVDDLQGIVDEGWSERKRAAEEARRLLDLEVVTFDRWRQAAELGPTIAALRDQLHALGHDELQRFSRRLGSLNAEQREVLEEAFRSLVQKILHRPITSLKAAADRGEAPRLAELYREIFGLDEARSGGGSAHDGAGPRRVIRGGKDD